MGNKIIIDSEVLAKISELIGDLDTSLEREGAMQVQQLLLENSTTISIDESIEESAEKSKNRYKWIDERDGKFHKESYIIGATEQSIISEIKSKEFKKCGIGDNVCNCKEEKDCGYL